jgi:hypothetical protein
MMLYLSCIKNLCLLNYSGALSPLNFWRDSANSLASVIINSTKVTLRLKGDSYMELSGKQ